MKFWVKIMFSALVAIALELLCFNFQTLLILLDDNIPKDKSYTLQDMTLINWVDNGDGTYISQTDPQLLIPSEAMRIRRISVSFKAVPAIDICTFYYTDTKNVLHSIINKEISKGETAFTPDEQVIATTRLDIGETDGVKLSDIKVTINPTDIHISVSRIIAVVLIYVCGSLLFRIQRMPDYTKYIQMDQAYKT
jgi:hypothetical protein